MLAEGGQCPAHHPAVGTVCKAVQVEPIDAAHGLVPQQPAQLFRRKAVAVDGSGLRQSVGTAVLCRSRGGVPREKSVGKSPYNPCRDRLTRPQLPPDDVNTGDIQTAQSPQQMPAEADHTGAGLVIPIHVTGEAHTIAVAPFFLGHKPVFAQHPAGKIVKIDGGTGSRSIQCGRISMQPFFQRGQIGQNGVSVLRFKPLPYAFGEGHKAGSLGLVGKDSGHVFAQLPRKIRGIFFVGGGKKGIAAFPQHQIRVIRYAGSFKKAPAGVILF